MEWKKLKNLIILILLMVNGFLLVLVGARREEDLRYEREALEQTVQVLHRSGIEVDLDAAAPADGLVSTSVERDLDRELQLAQALLGKTTRADNRGGGLYLYQNGSGELSVRAGGELLAEMADDPGWQAKDPERHAADLLKKMGIDAEQLNVTSEDEWKRVRFRQLWNGAPVFSCEVEFSYDGGSRLRTIQGTLLTAESGTAEQGQAMTLPTALMRFSEEIAGTGDVCSSVCSMEAGYRGTAQTLSGGAKLVPVWLVSTDTANYYLDCTTGALTRLTDQ